MGVVKGEEMSEVKGEEVGEVYGRGTVSACQ